MMSENKRWLGVVVYAIAMAWVESAVVAYLRILIDRVVPYQTNPLPVSVGIGWIEVGRELATMVMLFTVGALAGRTWRSRLAYGVLAFGVWDIFYYIFLVPMTGWPASVMDWDVLFLVPLPWWGPVLAPTLIAALMVMGGTVITQWDTPEQPLWPARWAWSLNLIGVMLALYVFMADALQAVRLGAEARTVLPVSFNWPLFAIALGLLAVPIVEVLAQVTKRQTSSQKSTRVTA